MSEMSEWPATTNPARVPNVRKRLTRNTESLMLFHRAGAIPHTNAEAGHLVSCET